MSNEQHREAAVERVEATRDLPRHVVAYLAVDALLVVFWALSGAGCREMERSGPAGGG